MIRLSAAVFALLPTLAHAQGAIGTAGGGTTADPLSLGDILGTNTVCVIGVADVADSVCLLASSIVFEGATADAFEGTLSAPDVGADAAWTLPSVTGTFITGGSSGVTLNQTIHTGDAGAVTIGGSSGNTVFTFGETHGGTRVQDNYFYRVGSSADSEWGYVTTLTPDAAWFGTSTDSNSFHFGENADSAFDFNNGPCATSACTDPTLIVHSANQSTDEWISFEHDQTDGVIQVGVGGIYGWKKTTVGASGAVALVEADSQKCYTITATSTLTLPNDPALGINFCVASVTTDTVTLVFNTGELLYLDNDNCAVSLTATTIGSNLLVRNITSGSGAVWLATGGGFTCND